MLINLRFVKASVARGNRTYRENLPRNCPFVHDVLIVNTALNYIGHSGNRVREKRKILFNYLVIVLFVSQDEVQ